MFFCFFFFLLTWGRKRCFWNVFIISLVLSERPLHAELKHKTLVHFSLTCSLGPSQQDHGKQYAAKKTDLYNLFVFLSNIRMCCKNESQNIS